MTLAWALLAAGVAAQVLFLVALRSSDGFRRPGWTAATVVGFLGALALVSQAVHQGLSLAVGYTLWTGGGVAAGAVCGVLLFGDRLSRRQVGGLVLVLLGATLVRLGA